MAQNATPPFNPKGIPSTISNPQPNDWLAIQQDVGNKVGKAQLKNLVPSALTTFTPTLSFSTPGNSTFAYSTQSGWLMRVGSLVFFNINLSVTPTFTTAGGYLLINGNPILGDTRLGSYWQQVVQTNNISFPAGSFLNANMNSDGTVNLQIINSASGGIVGPANMVSGVNIWIAVTGVYPGA
jgi:hypothetical protein